MGKAIRKLIACSLLALSFVFVMALPAYAESLGKSNDLVFQSVGSESADSGNVATENLAGQSFQSARPLDNDGLFEGYVELQLQSTDTPASSWKRGAKLIGANRAIYDKLRSEISLVADGARTSTVFEVSIDELGLDKTEWSAEDLGVTAIVENGAITEEASNALSDQLGINLNKVVRALLADCPYEMYWYDKVAGAASSGPAYSAYGYVGGSYMLKLAGGITVSLRVAQGYAAGDYQVDTTNSNRVQHAVEKAESVAEAAQDQSLTDYDRLAFFRDTICDLVTYDQAAADDDSTPYGDAWQIISVFDEDEATNVVCEGYSKAFQYLCDLTGFSGDISCITVTGYMQGGTGAGAHMWNIVNMEDGNNYLVDVTNSDEGTVGSDGKLFIVGYSSGNVADGYTFACTNGDIAYVYDANTLNDYEGELAIASEPYGTTTILAAGDYGENIHWSLGKDGTLTISGTGEITDPSEMSYNPVTGSLSGYPWKDYSDSTHSIVIEKGVTGISDLAFTFMPSVETVYLPDTVTNVTNRAFDGSRMQIVVAEGNPALSSENGMLLDKDGKKLISWPAAKGDVRIPDGIEIIDEAAFNHVMGHINPELYPAEYDITSVVFPQSLLLVDNNAFCERRRITSISFENDDTQLGPGAFSGCRSLESVALPQNLDVISDAVFQNCAISAIEIPDGVTRIGSSAFGDCGNLSQVSLPDCLARIEDCAFLHCASLEDVDMPANVKLFGSHPFLGTPYQEANLINGMFIVNDVLVEYSGNEETVVVPEGITDVCNAFYENSAVKTVVLPKSLTTLHRYYALIGGRDSDGQPVLNTVIFQSDAPGDGNAGYASWYDGLLWTNPCVTIYYPASAAGWDEIDFSYYDDHCELDQARLVDDFHVAYCYLAAGNVPVVEHSYSSVVTKQPTAAEAGVRTWTCTRCGDTYDEEIPRLDKAAYVRMLYREILGVEDPSDSRVNTWVANIEGGQRIVDVVTQFTQSAAFADAGYDSAQKVRVLYAGMLGNEDPTDFQVSYWASRLDAGTPVEQVVDGFGQSAAFGTVCVSYGFDTNGKDVAPKGGVADYVRMLYREILDVDGPTDFQVGTWVANIEGGQRAVDVATQFTQSDAFASKGYTSEQKVRRLYAGILGNGSPTDFQVSYWASKLDSDTPLESVIDGFGQSAAFGVVRGLYGLTK